MRIEHDRVDGGWTFVETIIVLAIIVIMTSTVAFTALRYVEQARIASARAQVAALTVALHAYSIDCGDYPTEAQGLASLWEPPAIAPVPGGWRGPYIDRPIAPDPWGRAYEYRRPGPAGLAFEIISFGADGLSGGNGDDADISSSG